MVAYKWSHVDVVVLGGRAVNHDCALDPIAVLSGPVAVIPRCAILSNLKAVGSATARSNGAFGDTW